MPATQFARLSRWTWKFLRDAPFRPREETITESIVVEIVRDRRHRSVVAKATQRDEAFMGHDWAWAVQTPAGWLHLLIQAKQISSDSPGRYPELAKASAANQARKLIRAAASMQAAPVYVFYNGVASPFGHDGTVVRFGACPVTLERDAARIDPPWDSGRSAMGVTIAHAKDVLARLESGSPTRSHAAEINVDVMPWECLFCPFWGNATVGPNSPGITDLAIGVGDGVGRASTGPTSEDMTRPWLRPAPPDWATQLLEVTQGREDQMAEMAWHLIDLPTSVQFALVTQLRDKNH